MCANVTSTAQSSPTASTGRSLFSRLTAPLKSRTRNLADFHIEPLEPHRRYAPGDLVKGSVVLTVVKPVRITHLTVCLHGFVHVYKNANGANEPLPDTSAFASGNPMKSQYFGNGYCSLFQDEVTLCGEGRLDAGVYRFNFELEFPSKGIPTSIDFERGTISYQISSTITRPTTIAATSTCERKVELVESVDVGPLGPPRPRTISLEPISKRSKRKKCIKPKDPPSSREHTDTRSMSDLAEPTSPRPDESVSQVEILDDQIQPRSPVQSDVQSTFSTDSTISSSTGLSFRLGPVPSSARSTRDSQGNSSNSLEDKTITATIELLKSGCLPGDYLPLKISVKHTKAIKSMHGIIITFYRQGRIDSAPPLSLFKDIKGKEAERLKHEEYYPKSKTGLGGLSLSSAGSTSVFRKDLSQTFAPLIVDPTTLTSHVTASVRVPEDCFPTINGVPGQMVNFKYQVEVVVDLGGKLAGQQRHVPRIGTVSLPATYGSTGNRSEGNASMLAAFGGSIVDTDHIRREKSVVACVFEVIVGTTDSARNKARHTGKQPVESWNLRPVTPTLAHKPIHEEPFDHEYIQPGEAEYPNHPYQYYDPNYDPNYEPNYEESYPYEYNQNYEQRTRYLPPSHTQIYVPPPEVEAQAGLSEKDRIGRAEQRLLPSQPPDFQASTSSSTSAAARGNIGPSAPPNPADEDLYTADGLPPSSSIHLASHPIELSDSHLTESSPTGPSAPSLSDLTPHPPNNTDDKQELERQRLLAEASAPSEFPDVEEEGESSRQGSAASAPHDHEPSAPIFHEEDEYGGGYAHQDIEGVTAVHESLPPRYER
ncbi:ph-response sensor protein [Ciborinia camelliae]|nr:ph-response sensor protein [Ciborinia camelliae]